jgi:hypothetical protein
MARLYGSRAYEEAQCLSAWFSVHLSVVAGFLDSVRNRVLGFALAIEAENPDAGEADVRSTPVEPAKVSQYFQTVILGGTNSVAAGGTHVSQRIEVNTFDVDAVTRILGEISARIAVIELKTADRDQIAADTASIAAQLRAPQPNHGMIREGLRSIRNILEGMAGSLAATGLLQEIARLVT